MNERSPSTPRFWKIGRSFGCAIFPLLLASLAQAAHLSALAPEPDWTRLEAFQQTITHDDFVRLLETVYAPEGASHETISIIADDALIKTSTGNFALHFATGHSKNPPRYWRPAATRKAATQPLRGVVIALDPGHLGGTWAKLEERWFQIGENTKPVTEGDMTLLVAKLLAPKLRALGADATLLRTTAEPVTPLRPKDLRKVAMADLKQQGVKFAHDGYEGASDPLKVGSIQWTSELLFYRTAEIRRRAQIVNHRLQPDLVLCLHFNAEGWGDEKNPTLVDKNHMHLLVNGSYSRAELALDDVRFEMLLKLLTGSHTEELPAAEHIAAALARATGLPPYKYTNGNAHRIGESPYVWARNLLANRLYACPVVYIEPYVMNSQTIWNRVQLGDYDGEQLIDGTMRKSIYREYADAVAAGLADYYKAARGSLGKVPK